MMMTENKCPSCGEYTFPNFKRHICPTAELETVKSARRHLEKDHTLALFMVRDLQVVKDMELDGLAWSMHNNYCVRSEVKWLLDELEAHLKLAQVEEDRK